MAAHNKLPHRKTTRARLHFSAEQGVSCLNGVASFRDEHQKHKQL